MRVHFLWEPEAKMGSVRCPFKLAKGLGTTLFVQCDIAIGVAMSQPFLGVSSLNFGLLSGAAFFLRPTLLFGSRTAISKKY